MLSRRRGRDRIVSSVASCPRGGRSEIWEVVEQIAMRSDFVSCHLSVGVYGAEHVEHIVGECPAILRKGCGAARIIGKNFWQQRLRHGDCIVRPVAARVFQFMGEGTDKAFDAANILVREEIVASELHSVEQAAVTTSASRSADTGAPSTMTSPSSHTPAARAP